MEFRIAERKDCALILSFIKELTQITVQRDCERLEWYCLDWNTPSINFYESLKAKPLSDWMIFRVTYDTLNELAK